MNEMSSLIIPPLCGQLSLTSDVLSQPITITVGQLVSLCLAANAILNPSTTSMSGRDVDVQIPEPPMDSFAEKLKDFPELLSVDDIINIFHVTPRTITNWERKGYIINVSKTSEETNSLGRRKRGNAKRYRKDAIAKSVFLAGRYNAAQ